MFLCIIFSLMYYTQCKHQDHGCWMVQGTLSTTMKWLLSLLKSMPTPSSLSLHTFHPLHSLHSPLTTTTHTSHNNTTTTTLLSDKLERRKLMEWLQCCWSGFGTSRLCNCRDDAWVGPWKLWYARGWHMGLRGGERGERGRREGRERREREEGGDDFYD